MVKIYPYGKRELTRKSLAKIWNLFPDEEICMCITNRDLDQFYKAKRIAYYYLHRGKDFSVEIDPTKLQFEVEWLLRIGVRKFYFPWLGLMEKLLFYSSTTLQYAMWIVDQYPDSTVTIVYQLPYDQIYFPVNFDIVETSIVFLGRFINEKTRLHAIFRRPHPWYGKPRIKKIEEFEKLALQQGDFTIEDECGCKTVAANTNIYCCPFCERKNRKQFFGNADRDKYVCGTVDRGIFRDVICNECKVFPNAKSKQISYINRG